MQRRKRSLLSAVPPESPIKRQKIVHSVCNNDTNINSNNANNLVYNENCNFMKIIFNAFGITLLGYIQCLEVYNLIKCGILNVNQFSYKSRLNLYLNKSERKYRFRRFNNKYKFLNNNFPKHINESSYSLWTVTIDFCPTQIDNSINNDDHKIINKYAELFEYQNKDSILHTTHLSEIHIKLILFYIIQSRTSDAFCGFTETSIFSTTEQDKIIDCTDNSKEFSYDEKGVNSFKWNLKFHEMMRFYLYEIFIGKKKDRNSWYELYDCSFDAKEATENITLNFLSFQNIYDEIKCCFKSYDKFEDCEIGNVYSKQTHEAYSTAILQTKENITCRISETNVANGLQTCLFIPELIDFKKWFSLDVNIFRQRVSNTASWRKSGYFLYFGYIDNHDTNNDLQFIIRKVEYEDSAPSDF
eukprot:481006_1